MDEKQIEKYLQQLENQVQKTVDDADPFRVQSYGQLERVQLVKQQVLKKQKQRLTSKLGADHPKVKKINNRVVLRTQVLRGVQLERKRSETKQPDIDPKDWILHGYLYGEKQQPLTAVYVMLADKSGKLIKQLGRASSDRKGYFRLIAEDIAKLLGSGGETGEIGKKIVVYAQVQDEKGVVLHRSEQALRPGPAQTDYLEIVVGKDTDVITPRPIRPINPIRPVRPIQPIRRRVINPRTIKPVTIKTD